MRAIPFSKYHGCGNDFIIVDAAEVDNADDDAVCARLAEAICDRHIGVGADGLIIAKRRPLEMVIQNSDGSRAPMCGNGIRCFAHYCRDEGILSRGEETHIVKTQAGDMRVRILREEPFRTEINMGKPDFSLERLGISEESAKAFPKSDDEETSPNSAVNDALRDIARNSKGRFLQKIVEAGGKTARVSCVFMGTIHTVVRLPANESPNAEMIGFAKTLSEHPLFREKTNVDLVRAIDAGTVEITTWERGAGLTAACGTGAGAVAVVGALEGWLNPETTFILPYGALCVRIENDGDVYMSGPSVRVAKGVYEWTQRAIVAY
ncbi:MAG: diaminopimelate epimerase [Clostridiales Family XIII bacterium]|jgi:diaminopimelate epimerase|nr:diaminopimelate epimerase [Clostridiales Family XIII bacterium]